MLQRFHAQFNADIQMIEQLLKKARKRLLRHDLIRIIKISFVVRKAQRHPFQYAWVDLPGRHSPLLGRIGCVVVLKQEFRIPPNILVRVSQYLHHSGGIPVCKGFFKFLFQALRLFRGIKSVDSREIERRRGVLSAPRSTAGQLIVLPLAKPAHIIIQLFFLRVECMGAVFLDQKAMFVHIVVHIAADVIPALPDRDPVSLLCKMTREHRAGKAAANYKVIHIKIRHSCPRIAQMSANFYPCPPGSPYPVRPPCPAASPRRYPDRST